MQNIVPIISEQPIPLSHWIHHQGPLTDKLQASVGTTALKVLSQQWQSASYWEKQVLLLKNQQVFQREILMTSQDKVYWYAKTIIPQSCYQLDTKFFQRLENESIRTLIFDTKEVHKANRIVYPIDDTCLEFYWLKHYLPESSGIFWVRFSELVFLNTSSFYLVEILLPELEQLG